MGTLCYIADEFNPYVREGNVIKLVPSFLNVYDEENFGSFDLDNRHAMDFDRLGKMCPTLIDFSSLTVIDSFIVIIAVRPIIKMLARLSCYWVFIP